MKTDNWSKWHTLGALLILVLIGILEWFIPMRGIVIAWLLTLGLMVLFIMILADGITGRFLLGWLINEEYRMSLSRLQMFLWTVVVLSAFLTAAIANLRAKHLETALAIAIPAEVWTAMGISTTSLVGSGLILGEKRKKKPTDEDAERGLVALGLVTETQLSARATDADAAAAVNKAKQTHLSGVLQRNESPEDARLYDLVRGEEIKNANVLDLTRVQNLFFTLILIGSYAASLGSTLLALATGKIIPELVSASGIIGFPSLHESAIALLGISHAGYLVAKAIDKEPAEKK